MAEAGEPGVADQQHQPDAGDGEHEDLRQLADVELRQQRRCHHEGDDEHPVPEAVAAVLEETDVVEIRGLEENAQPEPP